MALQQENCNKFNLRIIRFYENLREQKDPGKPSCVENENKV